MKRGALLFQCDDALLSKQDPKGRATQFFETLKLTKNVKLKATHFLFLHLTTRTTKEEEEEEEEEEERKETHGRKNRERLLLTREHCLHTHKTKQNKKI